MQQPPHGFMPPLARPGMPPGFPPGSLPPGMMMPPPGMMMNPQSLPHPGMLPPGMTLPPPHTLQAPAPLRPPASMRPPSNYIRPLQLPKPGSVSKPRPVGSGALKSTTLYVGKIAATVDDSTIKRLLEACGPVKSWKRMSDPETNKPKGFGFCEFEEADAVVRALQHLTNLDIDGQTLLVKCNAATQKYVDEYKARKVIDAAAARAAAEEAAEAAKAAQDSKDSKEKDKEDGDSADIALPPPPGDPDAFKDEQSLEKIMGIISERAPAASSAAAAAASSADKFLGGLSNRSSRDSSRHGRDRESSRSSRDENPEERKARELEVAFERAREKERRESEAVAAAADRSYKDHVRRLERAERDRQREAEARLDAKAAAVKARARAIRADEDDSFEDDLHLPPWRRADLSLSRRRQARRDKRAREEKEDAIDREADDRDDSWQRPPRNHYKSSSPSPSPARKRKQQLAAQQQHDATAAAAVAAYDGNDPIYRAMVSAAQAAPAQTASPSVPADRAGPPVGHVPAQQLQAEPQNSYAGPSGPKESGLASAFGDDDEEEKPKRKLIPLQYSPAELVAARAGSVMGPEEIAKAKAEVMQQLPQSREDLFKAPIDWALFDMAKGQLLPRLANFVDKKITQMLGEQETTLVTHVMEQLQAHVTAQAMLDDLTAILDDDAVLFVLQLYRAVLFDVTKLAKFGSL